MMARQRRREIGVRMALGAQRRDIRRFVLRQAIVFVTLGWLIGLAMASAGTKYIHSLLFQVAPLDTFAFIAASIAVLATGSAASWLPSFRAVRLSPAAVLREE